MGEKTQKAYDALLKYPNATVREIAQYCGVSRGTGDNARKLLGRI